MRGFSQEQSTSPEQYKMTIPIGFWEYWGLEGWEGGHDRTLHLGMRPEKIYYQGTLHAGNEIRLTLDPDYMADPELVLEHMGNMLKPLPTYDLVGIVEWVKFYDQEPYRIMEIRFSSVQRIPRQ